ncbi:MAG: hypothetical protein FWC09_07775, partial [Lachnospiraceae bacterium]|nr:hypothetical protein [Lachnospiraceae bacterium]
MKISAYRLIALLLTICLVINQPIMEAFASSFDAITNESDIFIESESDEEDFFDSYAGYDYSAVIEETDEEPFVIGEDTSVRGEYVKGFVMSDITTVLAAYSQPIHFIGEDGEWEEINNELIPIRDTESGEIIEYRTKANSFETTFQKEGDQNNLLELTEGDNKINFSLITAPEDYILEMSGDMTIQVDTVEATVTLLAETESAVSLNDDDITGFELNLSETEVLYEDVLPGVSLQYITLSNGVKENIILNQRADSYNYTFSLSLVGLKARLVDNTIELYDQNDPAKIEYIFPAPFMYDNNGEQSTLVSYNLTVINEAADLIDSIAPDMEILLSDMESEETAEPNEPSEIVEEPTENLMEETENEGNIESETAGHEEELIQTELLEFLLLTSLSENIDENSDIDETDTEDDTEELPDNNLEPSELEDDFETISPDESIPDENVMEQLVEDLDDAIAEKLKTENYYIFTINADENWINADERAFPVVVDPILQKLRANEADTAFGEVSYYCQHGNAECTHYSWETNIQTWGHVGRVRSDPSPSYVIFYVDLFYNFLSTPNIQISSAIFRIQTSCNIAKRLELYSESLIDFGTTTPNDPDAKKSLTFDITRLFMTGDTYAYFEIHAQNPNENNFVNITPQFGSSPYLTITYRDFTGLEPYISTHSQSVGRAGTGYITDYNGNLTYIHNDVSTVGNRMTADLKHVYNSTPNPIIKNLDPFTKAGNNWQLNYQQTLTTPVGEADINTYPHVWTDGDGTKHYFKKATVTYWVNGADRAVSGAADEDGLGLFVVPVEDAALKLIYPFKIVDRSGSTSMYFDKAGRLCLITDANQRENAANASTKDRNRIEIVYSNTGLSNATMDNGNFKYFSDTVQWLLDNLNIGYTTAEWRDYGLEIHQYITKDLFQTIIFFENREIDPFIRVDKSLNTEFNAFRTQIKALCDAPNSSIATRKTALTTAMTRIKNVQKKIDELDPILCRRIVKIIDAANKEIIIEYGSNGLISSISDPTIEIKAPVTTNKLHYKYNSSGDLTSITYPYPAPGMNSGNCESLYTYIDGRLASAKNETGYSISYSYHNNSYRDLGKVSRVDEYAGSVKGQSVSINYRYGESTTYRFSGKDNILGNADDVFNTYNFDFDGKTLSIRSESAGKLLGGSMYSYTPNGGQNANKLTESAQGSAHTINLLKNHSFERGTNGLEHWTSYSTCTTAANHTMDTVTTRPFIGKRTLRLQSRSGHNGRIGFRQTVTNLKPNVDYTYSGYIKTESFQGDAYLTLKPAAGAQIILSNESGNAIITNTDGSIQTLSVSENSSDIISRAVTGSASALNAGWVRVNITFRVSKETSIEVGVETAHTTAANKTTTAFFDALQLEEGLIANPYNIIEDASFEQFAIGTAKPGYWTFNNGGTAGSADIINGGIDGKQSFEIKGEFNKGKTLRQDLQLSNQASYVLSGWFKLSDVAPITGNRLLRVEVVRPAYDTVVANSTLQTFRTSIQDEWVYFCMALPKLANWDGAYLQFRHSNNVGKLEIDNIQLLRQDAVFSSYDTAGKLINRTAAATEEKTTRTRDLVRTHTNTSGNVATHTYDANTNDLTLTTYTVGPEERYTYDRYGNNLTKQTGAAALRYFDERTYSADGRFMLSESNIVGNMNKYNYNETNGLLERSINPNSITTDYSYNSRGQQTAVSHNIMGNFVGFLNTHATSSMIVPILPPTTFSYNSLNLLNSIGHNNFNYNFTYDAFGNRTSIKVENDTLTEYTYQAGNGVLL